MTENTGAPWIIAAAIVLGAGLIATPRPRGPARVPVNTPRGRSFLDDWDPNLPFGGIMKRVPPVAEKPAPAVDPATAQAEADAEAKRKAAADALAVQRAADAQAHADAVAKAEQAKAKDRADCGHIPFKRGDIIRHKGIPEFKYVVTGVSLEPGKAECTVWFRNPNALKDGGQTYADLIELVP